MISELGNSVLQFRRNSLTNGKRLTKSFEVTILRILLVLNKLSISS